MPCTEVKKSTYPPQKRSQIQKRFAQQLHCTEVKKSTYPPRNVRKSKKGSHNNCTALKFAKKEYLSSQKRSQIQKRFAQQLHCTEVKKSTYPPRNVRKSKKGSHNNCTALKSKRSTYPPRNVRKS